MDFLIFPCLIYYINLYFLSILTEIVIFCIEFN